MAELEFEVSDVTKLEDLGFDSDLLEGFQEKYPDKLVFTKKDTATNDFFIYHLICATFLKQLTLIDQNKLTASQKEKLNSKIRDFEQVEAVLEKEIELDEPTEAMFEIEKVEILVEDKEGNMQDVDVQNDLIDLWTKKNGELQTIVNKRDDMIMGLNRSVYNLESIIRQMIPAFKHFKVSLDNTTEEEDVILGRLMREVENNAV